MAPVAPSRLGLAAPYLALPVVIGLHVVWELWELDVYLLMDASGQNKELVHTIM